MPFTTMPPGVLRKVLLHFHINFEVSFMANILHSLIHTEHSVPSPKLQSVSPGPASNIFKYEQVEQL